MRTSREKNPIALVTGASEGIGKAIALGLLKENYQVVLVSRNQQKLDAVLAEAGSLGKNGTALTADLTESGEVNRIIETILLTKGRLDILVNNLGQGLQRQVIETTDTEWDFLVKVNLSSAFYLCRAVLPSMRAQGSGVIINIASRAGRRGEGDFAAYSALKHGLVGLTRALADSEKDFGLQINAICPGPVSTKKMQVLHPQADHQHWLTPEDVANTVQFLLSPAAKWMNGQVIDLFEH
ncbi:MAG: SDR family oxidoreductase [Anaerolineaceae bacterium]|nr:SDR family oxidoreductase [Anaerolineaceae bacterium]